MSTVSFIPFLDAATGVVYHVVTAAEGWIAPVLGPIAPAAVVVLATLVVRCALLPLTFRQIRTERRRATLAPRVEKLRERHRDDPLRAVQEVGALYRTEGVGNATVLWPLLAQAPVFLVLWTLFRAPSVAGGPNALLDWDLFGVPLGAHGTGAGLVLAAVLVALGAVATVTARRARRLGQPRWLAATPYVTVVVALTVPLAGALYLLTTTGWTAAENALLRDRAPRPDTTR